MSETDYTLSARLKNILVATLITLLALFCLYNIFVQWPFRAAVNISEGGITCLDAPGYQWFTLDSTEYNVVGGAFAFSHSTRSRHFIPDITEYTYYNIIVPGKGTNPDFVMAVRTKEDNAQIFDQGKTITLYGRLSKLDNSLAVIQQKAYDGPAQITSKCFDALNNTPSSRIVGTIVFFLLFLFSSFFALLSWGLHWQLCRTHRKQA